MRPTIDVVIPTRGRERLLPRVVGPLLADPAVGRVIVVDDADVTARASAIELPADRVEVIETGGVGPAKARQAGAERARAELVLFLDDDVVPDPGLASRHAERHAGTSGLVVCGYTPVVPPPGRRLSGEAEVYGRTYEDRCAHYDADRRVILTHLWGGNFSLRREDALRVGLASQRFDQFCHEDRDFGLRCLAAGMTAVFDRSISAGHEYERRWPHVGVEAYRRGYSVALLHDLHSAVIGPVDPRQFERHVPRPVALLVRAASRRPWGRPLNGALHAVRRFGALLRIRRVELGATRLLRRIEAARGMRDAIASQRSQRPAGG